MLYLHSSVVQGSMAHANNNPGVLYQGRGEIKNYGKAKGTACCTLMSA